MKFIEFTLIAAHCNFSNEDGIPTTCDARKPTQKAVSRRITQSIILYFAARIRAYISHYTLYTVCVTISVYSNKKCRKNDSINIPTKPVFPIKMYEFELVPRSLVTSVLLLRT